VRLLLDEMLSPAMAEELCSRGHDVVAVAGHPDRQGLPDPEIMSIARAERRAVVTNNLRDHRPPHYEAVMPGGSGHYGMVFVPSRFRRTKADSGRIAAALEAILDGFPGDDDLANGETWLGAQR
jgi:hypothetical protein